MTESASTQSPFADPPLAPDDAVAWARWAVEFLDRLCLMWNDWRKTWGHREVSIDRSDNPDAFLVLERVTRQVGTARKLVTGEPPGGILAAPPLLDACSHAVQRFCARSAWIFSPAAQADEIAQALLKVADAIKNGRYHEVAQSNLERLSQVVKMATRRAEGNSALRQAIDQSDQGTRDESADTVNSPGPPESERECNAELAAVPASQGDLKPAHKRAKLLYKWAMEHVVGAADMTYAQLFKRLTDDPRCGGEGLPKNAQAFARYCRAAGVQRNTPRRGKGITRSVRRKSDL